jgi:hypothetical protein
MSSMSFSSDLMLFLPDYCRYRMVVSTPRSNLDPKPANINAGSSIWNVFHGSSTSNGGQDHIGGGIIIVRIQSTKWFLQSVVQS